MTISSCQTVTTGWCLGKHSMWHERDSFPSYILFISKPSSTSYIWIYLNTSLTFSHIWSPVTPVTSHKDFHSINNSLLVGNTNLQHYEYSLNQVVLPKMYFMCCIQIFLLLWEHSLCKGTLNWVFLASEDLSCSEYYMLQMTLISEWLYKSTMTLLDVLHAAFPQKKIENLKKMKQKTLSNFKLQ